MKKLISFALLAFASLGIASAQIGCPAVIAGPDTAICGPGPHCFDLTAVPVSGFQTTSYAGAPIPYSPYPYNAATGNPVLINIDDTWSGAIQLPFDFCFFGQGYNQMVIGSNGLVSFDVAANAGGYCQWPINAAIPSPNNPTNSIMVSWEDIDPSVSGNVYWHLYGTAPCRVMVVSWDNCAMFSCNNLINRYQLALYETTNIIEMYIDQKNICATWNGGAAIQGIQDASGTQAFFTPGRNFPTQWAANNDGYAYIPNGAVNYTLNWYDAANPAVSLGNTNIINVCPTGVIDYVAEVTYNNCGLGTVTVRDTVNVSVGGANFGLNPAITNVSCFGGNDGSLTSTPTAGMPPYVYQWSNGGNTPTINNLPAGTYYVTVTDACTFTSIDTMVVTQPTQINLSVTYVSPSCQGLADGTATATASGGTPGYTYQWSNAATGGTVNNLAAGSYTVTVTDGNGCTEISTINIPQPPPLQLNAFAVNQTCPGANDGSVSVVPNGGTPSYTYLWNTGASTPAVTGLGPGTYTVNVVDANGCAGTASATVGSNPSPVANAGADVSFCAGEGGAVINGSASGTSAPYYYTWFCNQPICALDSVFDNDPLANPTDTTTYYLIVTDANGCVSDTDSVVVNVMPKPLVDAGPDVHICGDSAPGVLLNPTVSGSPGPFSYQWVPAVGLNDPTLLNPFARPDSTTIYTFIVTDLGTGCTSDFTTTDTLSTVTVIVEPIPIADAGPDRAICLSETVQLIGTGIGAGPLYDFEWSPNNSLSSATVPNPFASPTLTTDYILTVWSNGCPSYGDTVTITVNTNPTVDAGPDRDLCWGESTLLDAQAGGVPSTTTFSYFWSPGATLSDSTAEDPIATPTQTTLYYLYAQSAEGCDSPLDSVLVTVRNTPISEAGININWCPNTPMPQLTGSYSWHNNQVPTDPQNIFVNWQPAQYVVGSNTQNTVTVNPPSSTWFYFTTEYDSCYHMDSVLVTVRNDLGLLLDSDTTVSCSGDSVQLFANAPGGTGNASFLWVPSTGLSDPTAANPMAAPGTSTTYTVFASEGGCADTASITLDILPTPQAAYLSSITEGCADFTVNFLQNATDAILYVWDFGDGSPVENTPNPSHTYTSPGVYTVTMTAIGLGGCSSTVSTLKVEVYEQPTAEFSSDPAYPADMMIPGSNVHFTNESRNAISWTWDFGDGTGSTELNPNHLFSQPGTYFVTLRVMNAQGCMDEVQHGPYIIRTPELLIPNVFTPNDDGINDVFLLNYTGNQPYHLTIQDRWGVPMFDSRNKTEGWDGLSTGGNPCPEGVYFYVATIGDRAFTGQVTLMR